MTSCVLVRPIADLGTAGRQNWSNSETLSNTNNIRTTTELNPAHHDEQLTAVRGIAWYIIDWL